MEQLLTAFMYLVVGGFIGATLTVLCLVFLDRYFVSKDERKINKAINRPPYRQKGEPRKYWYGDESEDEVKRMLKEVGIL